MRRRWVRPGAGIPILALLMAVAGIVVLIPDAEQEPTLAKAVEIQPAKPLPAQKPHKVVQPVEPERQLPRLAAGWRAAIQASNDQAIMHGALELRWAPDGREQLLTLTDDTHARTRAYALRELGNRKEADLSGVFAAALKDDDPAVRKNAKWALEQLK